MSDELLDAVDKIDAEIRVLSRRALSLKHRYLSKKGWIVEGIMVGPTISHTYTKGDKVCISEGDAIEFEIYEVAE